VPSTKYCSPIRTDRDHVKHILVLPEGYYASPKRIVKALEAMKHQKGMKKGFSLGMSEVSYHPRFDQGAIHVQRIYSPGYVCHVRCFIISGWKIQLVEPQERL
jgi:hypothetical protein